MMLFILRLLAIQLGLASTYNDKIYACPKSSYQYTHLPTAAHRSLPCGSIITVKRIDNGKEAMAVIADRGPFGCCIPSQKNTRACGRGSKWINGRNFVKNKKPMNTATWRGILDMSGSLANKLGIKNRLISVVVYTNFANNKPYSIIPDDDDPKLERISNNIGNLNTLGDN